VPETVALAASGRALGAVAASAFGAGFGGSVWALVRADAVEDFIERWRSGYSARFPHAAARSAFLATRPGPAAMAI
jgi:galactokinase